MRLVWKNVDLHLDFFGGIYIEHVEKSQPFDSSIRVYNGKKSMDPKAP